MANYATLKAGIVAAIKENGNNEITGNLLQQQLLAMVNSLGIGYQYAGIATPDTNPGTPDQNVFYLASTAGTYTNFNGLVLADGEIAILKYNGAWSKDSTGAATQESVNQLGQRVNDFIFKTAKAFGLTCSLGVLDKNTYAYTPNSIYATFKAFFAPAGTIVNINDSGSNVVGFEVFMHYANGTSSRIGDRDSNKAPLTITNDCYAVILVKHDGTLAAEQIAEVVVVLIGDNAYGDNVDNKLTKWDTGGIAQATGLDSDDDTKCRSPFIYAPKGTVIINPDVTLRWRVFVYDGKDFLSAETTGWMLTPYPVTINNDNRYVRIVLWDTNGTFSEPYQGFVLSHVSQDLNILNSLDLKNTNGGIITDSAIKYNTLSDRNIYATVGYYRTDIKYLIYGSRENHIVFSAVKVNKGSVVKVVKRPNDVTMYSIKLCIYDTSMNDVEIATLTTEKTIAQDGYVIIDVETKNIDGSSITDATGYIGSVSKCIGIYSPEIVNEEVVPIPCALEVGTIDGNSGADASSSGRLRTIGYLNVGKGTKIYIPKFYRAYAYYYSPKNKTFLKRGDETTNVMFFDEDAYIRIMFYAGKSITEDASNIVPTWTLCQADGMILGNLKKTISEEEAKVIQSSRGYRNARTPLQGNVVNLLWFTDCHADLDNIEEIRQFYITYKAYITDAIHTGDEAASSGDYKEGDAGALWADCGISNFLNVIGNHDVYIQNENYPNDILTALETYDEYFKDYIDGWNVIQPSDAATVGKCYYYKDYQSWLRLIVLDKYHIDAAQTSWLENTLADAKNNELAVVIAIHDFPTMGEQVECSFSSIDYQTEVSDPDISAWTAAVDTFIGNDNSGKFICWIAGHIHHDQVAYAANTTHDQLMIAAECTLHDQSWDDAKRIKNTSTCNSFNIISFESISNVIKIARFGNPYDHYLRRKDTFCYDYVNKVIIKD